MKDRLIGRLFGYIGKKADGHKTKGAGVAAALTCINGVIGLFWPDLGLPPMTFGEVVASGIVAAGFFGLGGKLEKGNKAREAQTVAIEAQTEVLKKNGV